MNNDNLKIAEFALDLLKKYGADDAQCKVFSSKKDEINVDSDEFSLMRSTFSKSVVLTCIKDMRKGSVSLNKTDKESIETAAKECVENALASAEDDCLSIAPFEENIDFRDGIEKPDLDRFFDRVEEYMRDVKTEFPEVGIEQLIADVFTAESVFANTNGVRFSYDYGYYSLSSMYSAHDGDKTTSFNSLGTDFVSLDDRIIDTANQREMYELCRKELLAVPFNGKFTGTAVFAPSCVDEIIDIALDNFTSGEAIIDNTSPWRHKLGKVVASEMLTVSLIPLDERVICGERYTAEGYKSENCDVIRNGVLENFTLSEYSARKSGEKRCPNLSGSMEVKPGDIKKDEIISGIKQGILIGRLSGGAPASNGDFSAVAKNSFLIEDGKITTPVLETMISGNLAEMLMNISAISSETVCDGSGVMPWVAFEGVTVSGK